MHHSGCFVALVVAPLLLLTTSAPVVSAFSVHHGPPRARRSFHGGSTSLVSRTTRLHVTPLVDVSLVAAAADPGWMQSAESFVLNHLPDVIRQEEEPFKYAFMFPTMTCMAVLCQSAGIGGAALLSPLFLLVFPLLGPEYPLSSAASAIASALLTECFGFCSGLSGYWRRGLVDWSVAVKFWWLTIPAALLGAMMEPAVASETTLLRGVYATLMIGLCLFLTISERPDTLPEDCSVLEDKGQIIKNRTASDGTVYTYLEPAPPLDNLSAASATVSGASLTGLLGVGMGEVVLPQLVRGACMPLPVAAGTSVAIVVVTALTAAAVQFALLATDLALQQPALTLPQALVQVIPWSLVQYTVPGAILGGQIAPWIASRRLLDDQAVESAVAMLFGVIGVAFGAKCIFG